jgi:hypothetical protein
LKGDGKAGSGQQCHYAVLASSALVDPLANFFGSPKDRECFLQHRHDSAGSGIAGRSRRANFDGKSSEAAQLNAIASGHRVDDLTENGIEGVLNVALVKVRAPASDAPDEL